MASRTPISVRKTKFKNKLENLKKLKFSDLETKAHQEIVLLKNMIDELEELIVHQRNKLQKAKQDKTRYANRMQLSSRTTRKRSKRGNNSLFSELVNFSDYKKLY